MRPALAAPLILWAACTGNGPLAPPGNPGGREDVPRAAARSAQAAFETWRSAGVRGDFDTFFAIMSPEYRTAAFVADYRRDLERGVIPHVEMLSPTEIEAIRAWWSVARGRDPAPVLPDPIIRSAWMRRVFHDRYAAQFDELRSFLQGLEIREVAPGEAGTGVLVRDARGRLSIYQFVRRPEGWLLFHIVAPPQR